MIHDFQEIIDTCKAEAIAARISPTVVSQWRMFCRRYSEKYFTPLHQVLEMPPEQVVLAVFENYFEGVNPMEDDNLQELMEQIYAIEDPNYEADKEKDLQDFIDQAEEEEERRVAEGRPVHRAERREPTLNPLSEKPSKDKKKLPTEGYVNLSYLENQDKEES